MTENKPNIRAIALYLPQYHPIPENDEWWGKGFTEWTNVTKVTPRFKGHYQPQLPTDLGFYDLRLIDIMEQQAKLAKEHGISGFMYYHYWFNGKRVLEFPVNNLLKKKKPDFPFMLCWANENWSRNWDGGFNKVLLQQNYSLEDDRKHMEYLCSEVFSDERYIKIDNKPVFTVYKPEQFPDAKKTASLWNEICIEFGFKGIYLIKVESLTDRTPPADMNFDAALEFQPEWINLPARLSHSLIEKIKFILRGKVKLPFVRDKVFDYKQIKDRAIKKQLPAYKLYRGITPGWDNTPRRETGATILANSNPEIYGEWLQYLVANFQPYSGNENFIFINAWNEWAEGNHLEPCLKWGRKYLEVTKKIIENT